MEGHAPLNINEFVVCELISKIPLDLEEHKHRESVCNTGQSRAEQSRSLSRHVWCSEKASDLVISTSRVQVHRSPQDL